MSSLSDPNMSELLTALEDTFRQAGWQFRSVENREVIEADFEAHHTRVRVHAQAFAEIGAVSIGAHLSNKVLASRVGIVAEILMRTNEELTLGNFELLWDTGAILFRATNVFGRNELDPQIVASLVHSAVAEVDRLTPFIALVLSMSQEELAVLNVKTFLMREDLLPPVPDPDDADATNEQSCA
ncbi:MAG: hypothetical protein ACI9R3_003123 [Verrucomicrobiales bacterium]